MEWAGEAVLHFQRIALDNSKLAGERFVEFRQRRQAAAVHLDRRYICARAQQCASQPAGSGANFQHCLSGEIARNCRDAGQQLLVEQEVLAERLAGREAVAGNDFAQGREVHTNSLRAAHSPAMRIAAIIAPGLALPVPAIPNAVP